MFYSFDVRPFLTTNTPLEDVGATMSFLPVTFAYIGPETILPLASVAAAIGGVLLMFWNSTRRAVSWCLQKIRRDASQS